MRRALYWLLALIPAASVTCDDPAGPPSVATVEIYGGTALRLGVSSQLGAVPRSSGGDTLYGRPVIWTTADPLIAVVDTTGRLTPVGLGATTVTATVEGVPGSAPVTVTPVPVGTVTIVPTNDSLLVGDSIQLSSVVRDSLGQVVTDRPVTWAVSDSDKASVIGGRVFAASAGGFAVSATAEGRRGGGFLTAQYPVAVLTLPDPIAVAVYDTVLIVPELRSNVGTFIGGRPVTWTNLSPGVLDLSSTGVMTATAQGVGAIVATSEGKSDTSAVHIGLQPIQALSVFGPGSLTRGETTAVHAQITVARGDPQTGRTVAWSSSDTTVIALSEVVGNPFMVFATARNAGSAFVSAQVDTFTTSHAMTVRLGLHHLSIQPDTIVVAPGAMFTPLVELRDSLDAVLGVTVLLSYNVLDSTIASVDSSGFPAVVRGLQPGQTTLVGSAGAYVDTAVIVVTPAPVRLRWSAWSVDVYEFDYVDLFVTATDSAGNALTTPTPIVIETDPNIITLSADTVDGLTPNAMVRATGRHFGHAMITARHGTASQQVHLTVREVPVASVELEPSALLLAPGDTGRVAARVIEVRGVERPYDPTWFSLDSAIATVDSTGLITAIAGGQARVVADVRGIRDTSTIVVSSAGGPTLVDPADTLVPGLARVLRGTGLAMTNVVTIDGVAAAITQTTDSTVSVLVPSAPAFGCRFTAPTPIVLTTPAGSTTATAMLRIATRLQLATGESSALLGPQQAFCHGLATGIVDVAVVQAGRSANAVAGYELQLTSDTGAITLAPPPATRAAPKRTPLAVGDAVVRAGMDLRRPSRLHWRILEEGRQETMRVGPALPLLQAARAAPRPNLSVADSVLGRVQIRVPRVEAPGFCANYTAITARIVHVGQTVVVLEDEAAPLAGTMDSLYVKLTAEFDAVMYPLLRQYFGDPLALDSLLDQDGRMAMVFTPRVNQVGLGGFVVSCDFYPESVFPSSNTGELFYARVPTNPNPGFQPESRSYWWWLIRGVVIHEAKHLAAFAERLQRGGSLDEYWLEEGSAVLGEELWARGVYGTSWLGNATYAQSLFCDVRPTLLSCMGKPFAMFGNFVLLHDYLASNGARSPLGTTGSDVTFYGSAWSLIRWAMDHYAGGNESAFSRALVQDASRTGADNLEARTGRTLAEMLADWGFASLLDDRGPPTSYLPTHTLPSWNSASIYAGMAQDFPGDFSSNPLQPFLYYSTLTATFPNVLGGSVRLFRVAPVTGQALLLQVRSIGGGEAPPSVHVQFLGR